jgi:hypothetical protein
MSIPRSEAHGIRHFQRMAVWALRAGSAGSAHRRRRTCLTDIGSGAIVAAKRCLMRAAHRYNQWSGFTFRVEQGPDACRNLLLRDRLLNKLNIGFQAALVDNGVSRVAGHE